MKIISRLFVVIRLIHSRHRFLVDMSDANDPNATPDKEKGPDFQENMKEMLASALADVIEDILNSVHEAIDFKFNEWAEGMDNNEANYDDTPFDSGLVVNHDVKSLTTLTHALVLGLSANRQVNLARRDLLRPHLNKPYQSLCNPSTPVTSYLFGDDLNKQVDDLTKANKIGHKVQGPSTKPRYHPSAVARVI